MKRSPLAPEMAYASLVVQLKCAEEICAQASEHWRLQNPEQPLFDPFAYVTLDFKRKILDLKQTLIRYFGSLYHAKYCPNWDNFENEIELSKVLEGAWGEYMFSPNGLEAVYKKATEDDATVTAKSLESIFKKARHHLRFHECKNQWGQCRDWTHVAKDKTVELQAYTWRGEIYERKINYSFNSENQLEGLEKLLLVIFNNANPKTVQPIGLFAAVYTERDPETFYKKHIIANHRALVSYQFYKNENFDPTEMFVLTFKSEHQAEMFARMLTDDRKVDPNERLQRWKERASK